MDAESLSQVEHIVTTAITAAVTGLRQELATAVIDLRHEITDSREEMKRHSGVLYEDLHHKLDLVVEGMQFFRQSFVDVRTEIAHESQETRALLRLSYQQLHQRVENLENRGGTIERRPGPAG